MSSLTFQLPNILGLDMDDCIKPARSLWDDSLLTGHPLIDDDHRNLFAIILRLDELSAAAAPTDVLSDVLCQLADYSREHFDREEKLMRIVRYNKYTDHVKEHHVFVRKLTIVVDAFERGRSSAIDDCRSFVLDWFRDHVGRIDREFACHVREIARAAN